MMKSSAVMCAHFDVAPTERGRDGSAAVEILLRFGPVCVQQVVVHGCVEQLDLHRVLARFRHQLAQLQVVAEVPEDGVRLAELFQRLDEQRHQLVALQQLFDAAQKQ